MNEIVKNGRLDKEALRALRDQRPRRLPEKEARRFKDYLESSEYATRIKTLEDTVASILEKLNGQDS